MMFLRKYTFAYDSLIADSATEEKGDFRNVQKGAYEYLQSIWKIYNLSKVGIIYLIPPEAEAPASRRRPLHHDSIPARQMYLMAM
jgi:hypothetical protein